SSSETVLTLLLLDIVLSSLIVPSVLFLFLIDTPPAEFYPLSLHDALPISMVCITSSNLLATPKKNGPSISYTSTPLATSTLSSRDRKSTRLNSSHVSISYAVFCLKKKNK